MTEDQLNSMISAIYGAERAVSGLRTAFEMNAAYYQKNENEASDWLYYHYDTTSGVVDMLAALLDRLTMALTNDEIALVCLPNAKGGK